MFIQSTFSPLMALRTTNPGMALAPPAELDVFRQSEPSQPLLKRGDFLRATASTPGEFARGIGDQFRDAWEAITHPRETYEALKGVVRRVSEDPAQAGRDAVQAGKELKEKVRTNTPEANARLLGQNVPIPGVKQLAMLGVLGKVGKAARHLPGGPVQKQLEKMEKAHPSGTPKPGEVHAQNSTGAPREHAPGSEGEKKAMAEREQQKLRDLPVHPDSRAIEQPTPDQKKIMDQHRLDNPRALSSDFDGNGIHVKPEGQNVHIRYEFKDGKLSTRSADGATAGQLEAARLKVLSDPAFRKQLAEQIQSGLANKPPADPAARAHAEQFLQYLKSLDLPRTGSAASR